LIYLVVVGAVLGMFFLGFSTHDFVQHLDRQVHGLHCSFIPGLEGTDVSGSTGCHVTLMSPYSSVLRDTVWGGIPIAVPGMAVFAFLLAYVAWVLVSDRKDDKGAQGFLLAATLVPVLASVGMGYISLVELDAACKLCIGTYVASGLVLVGAAGAYFGNSKPKWTDDDDDDDGYGEGLTNREHAISFFGGVIFVGIALGAYIVLSPDFERYIGECGTLTEPSDPYGVMIPLTSGGVEAIEVLDPLCPSCRGLENRLEASGLDDRLARRAVLFPLDNTCNWMVGSAVHPGACTVSEAMLCADTAGARDILHWAFENQDAIMAAETATAGGAKTLVAGMFPSVSKCIGSAKVRSKLNKSLRWAVQNQLPVLTPQLYVAGDKLCDEDTDLGLDYALSRMLERI